MILWIFSFLLSDRNYGLFLDLQIYSLSWNSERRMKKYEYNSSLSLKQTTIIKTLLWETRNGKIYVVQKAEEVTMSGQRFLE